MERPKSPEAPVTRTTGFSDASAMFAVQYETAAEIEVQMTLGEMKTSELAQLFHELAHVTSIVDYLR